MGSQIPVKWALVKLAQILLLYQASSRLHGDYALLPISEFVLDEKFQRNASKFGIFYIYENLKLLFSFRANLFFPLMNAPVYVDIDQGIH